MNETNIKKAALFDLDGVLVDTEGIYTEFWADMDARYPTGVEDFAHVIKGSTLESILSTYFPSADTQEAIVALLAKHEREMRYRLFPGVARLLGRLREAGMGIAIVTSSNRQKMDNLFAQLPELAKAVDIVITDGDVSHSKPHPEGYLLAAERLGVPASQCYVFEDSLNGLRAGRAAGATVVGVATTNSADVIAPLCDIVLTNTADFNEV